MYKKYTCEQNALHILVGYIWWEHTYRSAKDRMTAQGTGALGPAPSSALSQPEDAALDALHSW